MTLGSGDPGSARRESCKAAAARTAEVGVPEPEQCCRHIHGSPVGPEFGLRQVGSCMAKTTSAASAKVSAATASSACRGSWPAMASF